METWQLAARLVNAGGYAVFSSDGKSVGQLDHVRYEHHADHPDSLIIKRGWLRTRWASVPFEAVRYVDEPAKAVVLSIPANGIVPLRQPPRESGR